MRLVLNESEALTLRIPVEYFIILFLAVWFLFFYNLKKQTTFLTENVLDALFKNHELNNKKRHVYRCMLLLSRSRQMIAPFFLL